VNVRREEKFVFDNCESCSVVKISSKAPKSTYTFSEVVKDLSELNRVTVECERCHRKTDIIVSVRPIGNGEQYSSVLFSPEGEVYGNKILPLKEEKNFFVDTNCKDVYPIFPRVQSTVVENDWVDVKEGYCEDVSCRAMKKVTPTEISNNFTKFRPLIEKFSCLKSKFTNPPERRGICDNVQHVLVQKSLTDFETRRRKVCFFGYRSEVESNILFNSADFFSKHACHDYRTNQKSENLFYLDPQKVYSALNNRILSHPYQNLQFITNRMFVSSLDLVHDSFEPKPELYDSFSSTIKPFGCNSSFDIFSLQNRPHYFAVRSCRSNRAMNSITTFVCFSLEMLIDLLQFDTGDERIDFVLMTNDAVELVKSEDVVSIKAIVEPPTKLFPPIHFFRYKEVHKRMKLLSINDAECIPVWQDTFTILDFAQIEKLATAARVVVAEYCDFNVNNFVINCYQVQLSTTQAEEYRRSFLRLVFPVPTFEEVCDKLKYHEFFVADFEMGPATATMAAQLLNQVTVFNQTLQNVGTSLDKAFGDSLSAVRQVLVSALTNLFIITKTGDPTIQVSAFINIVNSLPNKVISNSANVLITSLTGFANWCVNRYRATHQANDNEVCKEDYAPVENFITTLASVVVSFFSKNSIDDMKKTNIRMMHLLNLNRLSKFSKDTAQLVTEILDQVTSLITSYRFGTTDVDSYYQTLHTDLPRFLRGVTRFELTVDENGAIRSPTLLLDEHAEKLDLLRLNQLGHKIAKEIASRCTDPRARNAFIYFVSRQRVLQSLVEITGASIMGQQVKNEPYCFYCFGKPGTGKSHMIDYVLSAVYACMGETYDRKSDKYSKAETTTFWDGYTRQKVYSINDFLQTQDPEARNVMLSNFIQMGDRTPMSLDMAHIENKGNTYFSSEMIAISSQERWPDQILRNSLQSPEAFNRRIALFVEVVPDTEYLNGKKIRDLEKPFDAEACRYNADFRSGEHFEDLTFDELILKFAIDFSRHRERQKLLNAAELVVPEVWREKFLLATRGEVDEPTHQGLLDFFASLVVKDEYYHSKPLHVDSVETEKFLDAADIVYEDDDVVTNSPHDYIVRNSLAEPHQTVIPLLGQYEEVLRIFKATQLPRVAQTVMEPIDKSSYEAFIRGDIKSFHPHTEKYLAAYYAMSEKLYLERSSIPYTAFRPAFEAEKSYISTLKSSAEYIDWIKVLNLVGTAITVYKIGSALRGIYNKAKKREIASTVKTVSISPTTTESIALNDLIENIEIRKKYKSLIEDDSTIISKGNEAITGSGDDHTRSKKIVKKRKGRPALEYADEQEDLRKMLLRLNVEFKCPQCKRNWLVDENDMSEEQKNCPYTDCTKSLANQITKNVKTYFSTRKDLIKEVLLEDTYGCKQSEAAKDPCLLDVLGVVQNNICVLKLETGCRVQGIFIGSTILIFPNHIFSGHEKNYQNATIILNSTKQKDYQFQLSNFPYAVDKKQDVVFVSLTDLPPCRNIVKFFMTDQDRVDEYDEGYLLRVHNANTVAYVNVSDFEMASQVEHWTSPDVGDTQMSVQDSAAKYLGNTIPGDCGAPVFVSDKMSPRKIIGFHIIGTTGMGWCNILSQEYLFNVLTKNFPKAVRLNECSIKVGTTDPAISYNSNLDIYGTVGDRLTAFMPQKSKIIPSVIHGEVADPVTSPALIRRNGSVDPMALGISKGLTTDHHINREILDLAVRDLVSCINSYHSSYKTCRALLNEYEMINGKPGTLIKRIDLSTSAGYPYCLEGRKTDYLEGTHPNYHMGEFLSKVVNERETDLRQNIIPNFIVLDTLKDERRPIEKVREGKTRVFSCGSLDLTLLVRKYYMVAMAHLMENCVSGEVSVGINPHSDDWGAMYLDLTSCGNNWIAGDYGAYDKRMPYQVLMAVADVFNGFYNDSDENQVVRRNLMTAMASSLHLCNNSLYRIHHGMPSGVPITAVGNSIANSLLFRIAFLHIAIEHLGHAQAHFLFRDFSKLVKFKSYGDDHLATVSPIIPWFNMNTISTFFASIGIEYTDATKRAVNLDYVPVEEVQYLKRKFVERNSKIYAPLDINSINEMTNWITSTQPLKDATKVNCEVALLEMTHYPRADWEEFYKKIVAACCKYDIKSPAMTFCSAYNILRSNSFSADYLDNIITQFPSSPNFSAAFLNKFDRISNESKFKSAHETPSLLNVSRTLGDLLKPRHQGFTDLKGASFEQVTGIPFLNAAHAHLQSEDSLVNPTLDNLLEQVVTMDDDGGIQTLDMEKEAATSFKRHHFHSPEQFEQLTKMIAEDHLSIYRRQFPEEGIPLDSKINIVDLSTDLTFNYGCILDVPTLTAVFYDVDMYKICGPDVHCSSPYLQLRDVVSRSLSVVGEEDLEQSPFRLSFTDSPADDHHSPQASVPDPQEVENLKQNSFLASGRDEEDLKQNPYPTLPRHQSSKEKEDIEDNMTGQQIEGITKFSEAAEIIEIAPPTTPGGVMLTAYREPTLKSFIERPYQVASFEWTSTNTGLIKVLDFPHLLFKIPSLFNKLVNFAYFRADIEVEFRVNATSFHYGKIMVCHRMYPYNACMPYNNSTAVDNEYANIFSMSSLNHVFISPTSSETTKITLPFCLPQGLYDLINWNQSDGAFKKYTCSNALYVCVAAPLRASSATVPDVEVAVFARFKNVILDGFCDAEIVYRVPDTTDRITFTGINDFDGYTNMGGGHWRKKAPTLDLPRVQASEADAKIKAGTVNAGSPSLGFADVVKGVSTVIDLVGKLGIADYPPSTGVIDRNTLKYDNYTHTRGVDNTTVLAMTPDCHVDQGYKWMGGTPEETELANIASRYALLFQGTITSADTAGTRYCCFPVNPVCRPYRIRVSTNYPKIRLANSPASYTALAFRYWRGSMKFKLQVVASKFHSCRLRVSWSPVLSTDVTRMSVLQGESNVVSHVFDVVDDMEVEFRVPYLYHKLACQTLANFDKVGYVTITLVNSLTHPNSPVPDVNFLLWNAMCEDAQFYFPYPVALTCCGSLLPSDPENTEDTSNIVEEVKYPQLTNTSNVAEEVKYPQLPRPQAGSQISLSTQDTPLSSGTSGLLKGMMVGEEVTSIYDLMRRPSPISDLSVMTESSMYSYSLWDLFERGNRDVGAESNMNLKPSYFTYFAKLFRFYRGSFKLQILKRSPTTWFFTLIRDTNVVRSKVFELFQSGSEVVPPHNLLPVNITVPYLSEWAFMPMPTLSFPAQSASFPSTDSTPMVGLYLLLNGSTPVSDMMFNSAGDDFHVGGWNGVPMCFILESNFTLTAS